MKSNKKFPPALGAIVDQALKDKTAWIGKTVQEHTCEAIRKRGLSQENTEGYVCLTLDEAKNIVETLDLLCEFVNINTDFVSDLFLDGCSTMKILDARIKQAEGK